MDASLYKFKINFYRIDIKHFAKMLLLMPICILFSFSQVQGQSEKKIQRWYLDAKQYYLGDNFQESIIAAKKVVKANPVFVDAHLLLADAYNQLDSIEQEIVHLKEAKKNSSIALIIFRLGEAYYSIAKYSEAQVYYQDYFSQDNLSDSRRKEVQRKMNNCTFSINAMENPVEFQPIRCSDNINSVTDEYWPSLSLDKQTMIFTRLLKYEGQMPQEDFFISEFDSSGWGRANPFVEINTKWNEGAQTISADGKLLFFTACNRPGGIGSCDIYYSRFENEEWSIPVNAGSPVNSIAWEAQPTFSSDNRYLYFSSSRENGFGKKDLWRAEFFGFSDTEELEWGEPENLGELINSQGDEISPFIHHNNKDFYFISDYHTGMGGFDIFHSELISDTTFSESQNMGYPINTFRNEQGLIISSDGLTGYFSSERNEDTGMDIYSFELDQTIRPEPATYVRVKVVDALNKKPLKSKIDLVDLSKTNADGRTEITDSDGELLLCLPLGADYAFNVSTEGYLFYSQSFLLAEKKTVTEPFVLTLELQPVKVGAEMNLYNIYFETDSFTILPESDPELKKLSEFLNSNPSLKVEIQGHTDSSGNSDKNQILSGQRAQSVVDYLIQSGIDKSRMNSKGFGDTIPIETNETIEGRKQNRRTTIKIVGN